MKKGIEKTKSAFPKPPRTATSDPIKKTAVAVKNRPILKQKPVAVALIITGKSSGI